VSNYEDRLLVELQKLVVSEPRRNHRGRRFALAGGLTAAAGVAVAAGVLLLSAGTQAAYAVTKNADGSVTVEIDSLTDAAGLQAKLQAAGVNAVVEYLPEGKMCRQPWFTPAGHAAGEGTQSSSVGRNGDGSTSFTIGGDLPADETLVIMTQAGAGDEQALGIGWAQGTVPPCQVVDARAGSGPLGGPQAP
jgi:hypothetical protein